MPTFGLADAMDKGSERNALHDVHGSLAGWTVVASESPDFICKSQSAEFGVEVTEFFANQSLARLRRIDNYTRDLIERRAFRHKDDLRLLTVTKAVHTRPSDPTLHQEATVLFYEVPSLHSRIGTLRDSIAEKAGRYPAYATQAPVVDLIVVDGDHSFAFTELEDVFVHMLLHGLSEPLIASPFREVFLVTARMPDFSPVVVPLRANVFVGEIMLAERNYRDSGDPFDFLQYAGALVLLLSRTGFAGCEVGKTPDGDLQLTCGSVSYVYHADSRAILERLPGPLPGDNFGPVAEIEGIREASHELADRLFNLRAETVATPRLLYPPRRALP